MDAVVRVDDCLGADVGVNTHFPIRRVNNRVVPQRHQRIGLVNQLHCRPIQRLGHAAHTTGWMVKILAAVHRRVHRPLFLRHHEHQPAKPSRWQPRLRQHPVQIVAATGRANQDDAGIHGDGFIASELCSGPVLGFAIAMNIASAFSGRRSRTADLQCSLPTM